MSRGNPVNWHSSYQSLSKRAKSNVQLDIRLIKNDYECHFQSLKSRLVNTYESTVLCFGVAPLIGVTILDYYGSPIATKVKMTLVYLGECQEHQCGLRLYVYIPPMRGNRRYIRGK